MGQWDRTPCPPLSGVCLNETITLGREIALSLGAEVPKIRSLRETESLTPPGGVCRVLTYLMRSREEPAAQRRPFRFGPREQEDSQGGRGWGLNEPRRASVGSKSWAPNLPGTVGSAPLIPPQTAAYLGRWPYYPLKQDNKVLWEKAV